MLRLILLCLTAIVVAAAPAAAVENEQLLLKPPKGFKVGLENKTDKEMKTVLLPDGQRLDSWTEKLTAETFYKMNDVAPAAYRDRLDKAFAEGCPGATFEKVKDGTENLYPMVIWTQTCPQTKPTGKPEFTWLKAVQGRNNFYLLQMAHSVAPAAKQVKKLLAFLDATKVCDTRVPGQRCKLGK